jgi:hypothetical protein
MRASKEVSIDLTAEDLLAHLAHSPAKAPAKPPADYDATVEIELTAEQMDAMLSGSPPARG